jgi:hypothetical protein
MSDIIDAAKTEHFNRFVKDCLVKAPGEKLLFKDARKRYTLWLSNNTGLTAMEFMIRMERIHPISLDGKTYLHLSLKEV